MSDPNGSKHLNIYTEIALLKMSPPIYDRGKSFGQKPNHHDPNPSTRVSNMAVLRYREVRCAGFNSSLNRHQNLFEDPVTVSILNQSLCSARSTPMLQGPDLTVDICQFCLNTLKPSKKTEAFGTKATTMGAKVSSSHLVAYVQEKCHVQIIKHPTTCLAELAKSARKRHH